VERTDIAIVGGGLASARVVSAYREAGGEDAMALLSADTAPPYHRPPLSKRVLRGEAPPESALVEPESWYEEHQIGLRLRTRAEALDLGARELRLAGGDRLGFDRLVIATGAWPRVLDLPGAELDGVRTLRTLDDARALRDRARAASRAVVVGTGFIGLETAASMRSIGTDVTLVASGHQLFGQLGAPAFSDHLAEVYAAQGVELLLGDSVEAFLGDDRLRAVRLSGGEEREAELAVVGVGVEPMTAWLEGSSLEVENGVVVDERYATSADGVFAVGDVAAFYDPVFGRRRRIEHWSNANHQGAQLGRILAGADEGYDIVSAFFTELFGTTYKVFGDSQGADELVQEGDFADGAAVMRYLREDRPIAALLTGQTEERENELKEEIRQAARAVRST
jgi:3-phenylpropionate/trans-cinnamate dioxygenase ferredoxin reductase component